MIRYLAISQIAMKTSIWHTLSSQESLTDHQIAIVFQPTAWASPALTKTNWRADDRLEVAEIFFFHQICAKWFSSLENDLWLNI